MYKRIIGLLAITLFFNACTSREDKIEEILKITEDNMVFVKGGSVHTSNIEAMTFNRHKKKLTSYANAFRCVLNPKK